ncbi:hypothetical protein [Sulfitobacter aestuariivivens]|uniref:Uncharacterized protein n=1 Tax=Sulfitobacter aestuariivivens TaxID=2766981 RepID=A0A927D1U3_9RHOB|nr:hypothetical protein [Sulfitobacter aestuariivivens]MBD3663485.1 hypothetical protein [Sulfitobacter aestuariivivens]
MGKKPTHGASGADWHNAKGLLTHTTSRDEGLQCALVPDARHDSDQIAVVYDKGDTPPEITIRAVSGSVHTVMADGIAVAVVASASGPAPSADDVLLVERSR